MTDRNGIFSGEDPFEIARRWLTEAEATEINDPNAAALATVDANGLPNVRIVLLKDIEDDGFVFYTNFGSTKSQELLSSGMAAFNIHWKSLRRQIRVRGRVTIGDAEKADAYYNSRPLRSRLGAYASRQSEVLKDRSTLETRLEDVGNALGDNPVRPKFWGGFHLAPVEIEFWSDGANRLHDRFKWKREIQTDTWEIHRLYP